MSTLQQLCPSCNRLLELPADAAGRLGQCPACDATFTIGQSERDKVDVESPAPSTTTAGPSSPAAPEPAAAESPAPETTPANPFSAPLESDVSVELPPMPQASLSTNRDPVAEVHAVPIVVRSIEEVLSATSSVFAAKWLFLVIAVPLMIVLPGIAAAIYVSLINALSRAGANGLAGLGILIAIPIAIGVYGYVSVGITRLLLAVARNSPTPLKDAMPTAPIVIQFLIGVGVILAAATAITLVGTMFIGIISTIGNEGLTGFVGGMAAILATVASLVALWLLWSWMLIVSDGRASFFRAVRIASTMTMHTKMSTALMILVGFALTAFGLALCYVGSLVTVPLVMLMFTVAYLLMTNQQLGDFDS